MDDEDIIERLGGLSGGNELRPNPNKMARFRAVYHAVEEALTRSSQKEVLAVLNAGANGLGLSLACFKSYLQRMRREGSGGTQDASGRSAAAVGSKGTQGQKSLRPDASKPSMSEFLFPERL